MCFISTRNKRHRGRAEIVIQGLQSGLAGFGAGFVVGASKIGATGWIRAGQDNHNWEDNHNWFREDL